MIFRVRESLGVLWSVDKADSTPGCNITEWLNCSMKGNQAHDSVASPTTTSTFLIPFLAKASSAMAAYSGENSKAVTWPSGPTAELHPIVEKPMKVPISRTVRYISNNSWITKPLKPAGRQSNEKIPRQGSEKMSSSHSRSGKAGDIHDHYKWAETRNFMSKRSQRKKISNILQETAKQ